LPKPPDTPEPQFHGASDDSSGTRLDLTGYLADPAFIGELREELGDVCAEYGALLFAPGPARPVAWARDIWVEPRRLPAPSITLAAKALRQLGRDWTLYPYAQHRRASLIQEGLPKLRERAPWTFGQPLPARRLGSWMLLDKDSMIASAECRSPLPLGELEFVEEKSGPPSRAYLKLWEALSLMKVQPKPGERCLDLGAAPGGWTWVLAELGADVLAIDRAPLAPNIASRPNIQWQKGNAFSVAPEDIGPIDWLFFRSHLLPREAPRAGLALARIAARSLDRRHAQVSGSNRPRDGARLRCAAARRASPSLSQQT
jgi:23S rRNA (cytidine2498-2'-O)-methyltransferase